MRFSVFDFQTCVYLGKYSPIYHISNLMVHFLSFSTSDFWLRMKKMSLAQTFRAKILWSKVNWKPSSVLNVFNYPQSSGLCRHPLSVTVKAEGHDCFSPAKKQTGSTVKTKCVCLMTYFVVWDSYRHVGLLLMCVWIQVCYSPGGWMVYQQDARDPGGRFLALKRGKMLYHLRRLGLLRVWVTDRGTGAQSVCLSVCTVGGFLVCPPKNYSHNHNMPPLGRLYINTYSQH